MIFPLLSASSSLLPACFHLVAHLVGGDIVGLAMLLGHSSLDTTRIYSQPTIEQLSRRVEQLQQNAYVK